MPRLSELRTKQLSRSKQKKRRTRRLSHYRKITRGMFIGTHLLIDDQGNRYIKMDEAARRIGVSPSTLHWAIQRGLIPHNHVAGYMNTAFLLESEIERYIRLFRGKFGPKGPRTSNGNKRN